jgi:DNA mismatch repair protein MSH3
VALKSKVLNDIISSLPRLREPMKDILKTINLQKLAQGDKTSIWSDWDRHPEIEDAKMVCFNMVVYTIHLIYPTGAASDR